MTLIRRFTIISSAVSFLVSAVLLPVQANELFVKVTEKSSIISGDGEGSAEIATYHAASKPANFTTGDVGFLRSTTETPPTGSEAFE